MVNGVLSFDKRTGKSSGPAAHQVRIGHQRQNRQGACLAVPPTLLARADQVIE
jgi:hypothetical protein